MASPALEKLQAKVEKAAALLASLLAREKEELQKLRNGHIANYARTLGTIYRAQVNLWSILKKSWFLGNDPLEQGLFELNSLKRKALPEEMHAITDLEELLELIRDSREGMAAMAASKLTYLLENIDRMLPKQLAAELDALGKQAPLNPQLLGIAVRKIGEVAKTRREAIIDTMTSFEDYEERDGIRERVRRDVYNQKGFDIRIAEAVAQAARDRKPFSVVYFDLNDFKDINDTYGHDAGDEALRHFVRIVHALIRGTDTVIRKGGDEFVIIFPGLDCANSEQVTDKIKEALTGTNLVYTLPSKVKEALREKGWKDVPDQASIPVSASSGCSVFEYTKTAQQVRSVLQEAEARMYKQKRETKVRRKETTLRRTR